MICIRPACAEDAAGMLAIYAPFVQDTAVSFELDVPDEQEFASRIVQGMAFYPWLVAVQDGRILGYAYASLHRSRKAYQWACECSAYLAADQQGTGLARTLYTVLLNLLRSQGLVQVLAGIAQPNVRSVRFHEACGFRFLALYPAIGFKAGAWHDVAWYSCFLGALPARPENPRPWHSLAPAEMRACLPENTAYQFWL